MTDAALPPHSAEKLCLSVRAFFVIEAMPQVLVEA
jgi:hypothetical protein